MILQALKEYYDRKPDLPRGGFEMKEIPYIIVLNHDGYPVALNETYEGEGKARRAKRYLVPQGVKRSVGIAANLLWDNPEYALGAVLKGRPERVTEQHAVFRKRVEELGATSDAGLSAVRSFLSKPNKEMLLQVFGSSWEDLKKSGANISFQLAGQPKLVVEQPTVQAAVAATVTGGMATKSLCLVTGDVDVVERLHTAIKGVWGAQSSGANIVSFNLDAFRSFNKDQGSNAPIGKSAAFAYTTALNHLLDKDSKQRLQVGDASTVFWSERTTAFEREIVDFFGEPPKDDPDRNTNAARSLLVAVANGTLPPLEAGARFYVLGLAPNASRVAVRFWIVATVAGMAERICQHFKDTQIVHGPRDKDTISLFRLLVSTATQGKSENIPPNLGGETMRAILEGLPYPHTLLQAAIRRIRAEHEITYPRAALIKACLNRWVRLNSHQQLEELHVALDLNNVNIGYRLGRLFAALEKIQSESSPGINATIRDKFYGAASSTPVTVFGNLMRLKNHHLGKLDSTGRKIQFEKILGEIMSGVGDFPSHLVLEDQGRFAIGYYHQMQDFFTKKTDNPPPKGN